MKYKDERATLILMGHKSGLIDEQIYFLLALRELEDGSKGNEFNIKAVQGTNLREQAQWAIDSIKKNDGRWQDYIRDQSYMDFPSFFMYLGGPLRTGWHGGAASPDTFRLESINKLKQLIEEIKCQV